MPASLTRPEPVSQKKKEQLLQVAPEIKDGFAQKRLKDMQNQWRQRAGGKFAREWQKKALLPTPKRGNQRVLERTSHAPPSLQKHVNKSDKR
jgi:hypothetical protein